MVVCAARPESRAGLVLTVLLVWLWAASVEDVRTPWVLPGAAGMLAFHVGMALAATGPAQIRWHRDVVRRWASRSLAVAAITCAAWIGVRVAVRARVDGGATVLVVATVLIAVAAIAARARQPAAGASSTLSRAGAGVRQLSSRRCRDRPPDLRPRARVAWPRRGRSGVRVTMRWA